MTFSPYCVIIHTNVYVITVKVIDAMNEIISMFDDLDEYDAGTRSRSCFFTGHRDFTGNKDSLFAELKKNISYLYSIGVKDFHAGGALGFDTLAATTVVDLKRFHEDMRLILNLPYRNQTDKWNSINKERYEYILKNADEVTYSFDGDVTDAQMARKYLLKRNREMVDCSQYGIVYFSGELKSGTGYTVRYANEKNCEIVNLY